MPLVIAGTLGRRELQPLTPAAHGESIRAQCGVRPSGSWRSPGFAVLGTRTGRSGAPAVADFQVFVTAGTTVEQVVPNGGTADREPPELQGGSHRRQRRRRGGDGPSPLHAAGRASLRAGRAGRRRSRALRQRTSPSARRAHDRDRPVTAVERVGWDIVADRAGSYVLRAEITQTSVIRPRPLEQHGLGDHRGQRTVGGRHARRCVRGRCQSSRLRSRRPVRSSRATVRVTAGGAPIRPTAVACAGTIGTRRSGGAASATSGSRNMPLPPSEERKGEDAPRGGLLHRARDDGSRSASRRSSAELGEHRGERLPAPVHRS